MIKIIEKFLVLWAKLYIWRFKPVIIGVTGNVGKTSTKEAIAAVLSRKYRVRESRGNLNTTLGVALTIVSDLGDEYYRTGGGLKFWFRALLYAKWNFFFGKNYPEVLVLEFGADRPGDIKRHMQKYKPHVGVVTAVGTIPVHVEFFAGSEELAREKAQLIKHLLPTDFAILNSDDDAVLDMKNKTQADVRTFGFGEGAQLRISGFETRFDPVNNVPTGVIFNLESDGRATPVRMDGALGKAQAYAAAAAAGVGLSMGINLPDIAEALFSYHGPKGRLRILKGIKNSIIIDDTYNAAPSSTHMALDTIQELKEKTNRRVVAALGDMLELGEHSIGAHQEVGNRAGSVADVLVCVGEQAKFIADSAGNQMPSENIFTFHNSDDAKIKVQQLIKEGDIVLVKGSQGKRMEKITEEILAEPGTAKDLLVRQSDAWKKK